MSANVFVLTFRHTDYCTRTQVIAYNLLRICTCACVRVCVKEKLTYKLQTVLVNFSFGQDRFSIKHVYKYNVVSVNHDLLCVHLQLIVENVFTTVP